MLPTIIIGRVPSKQFRPHELTDPIPFLTKLVYANKELAPTNREARIQPFRQHDDHIGAAANACWPVVVGTMDDTDSPARAAPATQQEDLEEKRDARQ
jgi:hypothetical protein